MARVLRTLMLLVSFAALQLTLASGGPGCPMPIAGAAHSAATLGPMRGMDMSATDMAGMDMAGMDMGAAATTASGGEDAALHAQPCDEATAPVTCPTMAPCAFAALPSLAQTAATTAATAAVPSGPAALRVLMPPSESAAPELPPPRA